MKKKLALILLAAVSCVCFAFGFSACGEDDTTVTPGGTTDNTGSTTDGGSTSDSGNSGGSTSNTHNMTYYAATDATCTDDGHTAYYYCGDCGKYFSDANGTTEIQLSSTAISALGHDYEVKFSWNIATDNTVTATKICSRCGAEGESVAATFEITSQVAATCTEKGSTGYTATATFSDGSTETDTKTITENATGHTYSTDWTNDEDYHWHAAICEHTDEISEKAFHTYVKDSSGNYACSVCGHTRTDFITSSADALSVGTNYIILNATTYDSEGLESASSYISNVTLTATASGTYTFTLPTDCQAMLYFSLTSKLGDAGYGDSNVYTLSFDIQEGDSLTIETIRPAEGVVFDSEYVFALTIDYVYKYVSSVGTEDNPYAFTNPTTSDTVSAADTFTTTIAAGESFYFTVANVAYSDGSYPSDTLAQVYFSNSDATVFELYVDGTKVDYGTYYYYCTTTAVTFRLKNVSSSDIENTIYSEAYTATLSTSDNELTITPNLLDSSNSISYTLTAPANTSYILTLGSGTDENAAIYYLGYYDNTENTLILGKGATDSSYIITNITSKPRSYDLNITYTGSTVPSSFKVYLTVANYDPDDYATYTELTLDTATETAFDTSSATVKAYLSYNASAAGSYTLTLSFKQSKDGAVYTWGNIYTDTTTVKVNGTTVSGTDEGVYVLTLSAGENKIVIDLNATGTLKTTLTGGGSGTEVTATALSSGANTVYDSTLYSFTASTAGTYTFTISGSSGYVVISESSSASSTVYLDQQGNSETTFTKELSANETINLYITDGNNENSFTLTIS